MSEKRFSEMTDDEVRELAGVRAATQIRPGDVPAELAGLIMEIGKQDRLHPSGYPYTRDGIRLGIAALEDETREARIEWNVIKRGIGDGSADPGELRGELMQAAAVAMRIIRSIDEGTATAGKDQT